MNRNANLTVESLEGKMLAATSTIGIAAPAFVATAPVTVLPHGPATGTGFTGFATTPVTVLPHGPATGTGFTGF